MTWTFIHLPVNMGPVAWELWLFSLLPLYCTRFLLNMLLLSKMIQCHKVVGTLTMQGLRNGRAWKQELMDLFALSSHSKKMQNKMTLPNYPLG